MSMLVWITMAIAIWHFTVFLPDRWWAGIVGAFAAGLHERAGGQPGSVAMHNYEAAGVAQSRVSAARSDRRE